MTVTVSATAAMLVAAVPVITQVAATIAATTPAIDLPGRDRQ